MPVSRVFSRTGTNFRHDLRKGRVRARGQNDLPVSRF